MDLARVAALVRTREQLLERIVNAEQSPIFILGSGLTVPSVPGTEAIARLIDERYERRKPVADATGAGLQGGNRYREAFAELVARRGQDEANAVIRHAVLLACSSAADPACVEAARRGESDKCAILERDVASWSLNDGLRALARSALSLATQGMWIFTTNFDPLIEICLRAVDGDLIVQTFGSLDGPLVHLAPGQIAVVKVHGDWRSSDTQHTADVLAKDRPLLESALANRLNGRLVVVVGYAGWTDVITRALARCVSDPRDGFDVRWAFFESDPEEICERYQHVLDLLAGVLGNRAQLHAGVDAHQFFPELAPALSERPVSVRPRAAETVSAASAVQRDRERALRARELATQWRDRYASRIDELRAAALKLRHWIDVPPARLDSEVAQVYELAGEVARSFKDLPIRDLWFARQSFGLRVHDTVFGGEAIKEALHRLEKVRDLSLLSEEQARLRAELEEGYELAGVPDPYAFELLHRLVESAVTLTRFNLKVLPRGFRRPASGLRPDIPTTSPLVIAQVDGGPELEVRQVEEGLKPVDSFSARDLPVSPLCAKRNLDGTLDIVGRDGQNVYYWPASSRTPRECEMTLPIVGAGFLSAAGGAPVVLIDSHFQVSVFNPDGNVEYTALSFRGTPASTALVWVDPLDQQRWYTVALSLQGELVSGLYGKVSARKSLDEIGSPDPRKKEPVDGCFVASGSLALGSVDGFECLVVTKLIAHGTAVSFLDPISLSELRRPVELPFEIATATLAAERWLVCGLGGRSGDRLAAWMLQAEGTNALGSWLNESADVYEPMVVSATNESFDTIQVVDHYTGAKEDRCFRLWRLRWPPGTLEALGTFRFLRVCPVQAPTRV